MNSNWSGLFNSEEDDVSKTLRKIFNKDESVFSRYSAKLAKMLSIDRESGGVNLMLFIRCWLRGRVYLV